MRYIFPVLAFGILVIFLFVGLFRDPSLVPSPLIGKSIPDFTATTLRDANRIINQDNLRGQVALVNVWATWCPACKHEHPVLVDIAKRKLVPIYGLNYKDDRALAVQWLNEDGDPYTMSVFDESGRIGIDFGVYGAPETFVIDQEGIIRYKHVGVVTPQVWTDILQPVVLRLRQGIVDA